MADVKSLSEKNIAWWMDATDPADFDEHDCAIYKSEFATFVRLLLAGHARAEAMQTALREDLEDAMAVYDEDCAGEEHRDALKSIVERSRAALDGSAS